MVNLFLKTLSRYLLNLLCFFGFVYQSYHLYSGYMNGKTVVNIKVEKIVNQTLPGFTICYPSYYSAEKIDDRNDSILRQLKQNYLDNKDLEEKLRNNNHSFTDKQNMIKMKMKIQNRIDLSLSKINTMKFFEKITLPFTCKNQDLIQFNAIGLITGSNGDMIKNKHGYISYIGQPLESLALFEREELGKCFTSIRRVYVRVLEIFVVIDLFIIFTNSVGLSSIQNRICKIYKQIYEIQHLM